MALKGEISSITRLAELLPIQLPRVHQQSDKDDDKDLPDSKTTSLSIIHRAAK
jgi:hypothetical protein